MKAAVVALLLITLPLPLDAKGALPGVRFDKMPVGCRIHAVFSTGAQVIDEYLGARNGKHVVRTTEGSKGRKLVRTTQYDADGFMVRKDWAGGKWETFAPFSCFARPGACTYVYRNADGDRKTFRGKVVARSGKFVSTGGFEGEAPFAPTTVVPGPFNTGERWSDGTTSFRVTKYENCGETVPRS